MALAGEVVRVSAESRTPSVPYRCHRCDVECALQPQYDGGRLYWYCSCCRSWTRTAEMIEADMQARADERGMTLEQLHEETMANFIDPTPLSPDALRGLQSMIAKRAEEWVPVCPHETENPWG